MSALADPIAERVSDPTVRQYLQEFEPEEQWPALERAARIGILAMQAASGALDSNRVERAFEDVHTRMDETLKEYFREKNGRLHLQLDSAVAEISKALEAYFGPEAGKVQQIFQSRMGPGSDFARSLDLGHEASALARLEAKLREHFEKRYGELFGLLNQLKGQRETAEATPLKGGDFEQTLYPLIMEMAAHAGDIPALVKDRPGVIRNNKKGDIVIEVANAGGRKIVFELKKDRKFDLKASRDWLLEAKRNRQAQIGVFVYEKGYEPREVGEFAVFDRDLYCTVAPGEAPLYLEAAYRIARASLALDSAAPKSELDVEELRAQVARAGKAVSTLAELEGFAATAQGSVEKVLDGLRNARKRLEKDLEAIEEALGL
jgi:hypothetical protein